MAVLMLSTKWSKQLSTDMTMSVESIVPKRVLEVKAPVFEGLQVIVTLNCRLSGGVNGRAPFDISASGAYLVLASGRHEGYDRFEPNILQRYVKIGIDPFGAERCGLDLEKLAKIGAGRLYSEDVVVIHQPLTPVLRAIASQVLLCPLNGVMKDMYLAGKGLEMAVAATEPLLAQRAKQEHKLSGADLERIWHARELALSHYQQPLSLHELARQVGTNVKKLAQGYRQLFGMSVFESIQQHRLHEAYRMLSTGAYSVSEVASFVGYAIPHFSTLFRSRFGFSPSQLIH